MLSKVLHAFSSLMVILNRGLAWLDFVVHYVSGYMLYYFLGGIKPQTHTIPGVRSGRIYSPSVVVTGASEGIGLATALRLARGGDNVFATVKDMSEIQRPKAAAEEASDDIEKAQGDFHVTVMDVLSEESIAKCANHIAEVLEGDEDKPLIAVVNNAGFCMISPMELTTDEDVRRVFDMNIFAYISVIRAFLPIIKINKGRFVNISSFGSYANVPMWVPYCAAKAAVENMTRAWRFELMPFGVGKSIQLAGASMPHPDPLPGMTSIRPGWTRTGGVGPKIRKAWENYYDNIDKGAIGVDSLGNTIMTRESPGAAKDKLYRPILDKW
ncbi:NAD(P)-binding protein [Coniochaeta sp. PMI_546]|nr:NAD(P)-binding protein [Coniochaeta sp. PMI_546]